MNTEIIYIIFAVSVSALIIAVVTLMYTRLKQTRYNAEKNMAQLESIRESLEKKMYELNDRILRSDERWKDINHLLIRQERTTIDKVVDVSGKVQINRFLRENGIDEKDVEIDNDLIFVLTPFNEKYRNDYETIRQICTDVGFKCKRGDEQYFSSDIFPEILKQIVRAKLIIANTNGRNANVLYELGIAHALDKPVLLISEIPENIPVDIKSKRFIIYENAKQLKDLLKNELIKVLKDNSTTTTTTST